jgi:hypothetical protein
MTDAVIAIEPPSITSANSFTDADAIPFKATSLLGFK